MNTALVRINAISVHYGQFHAIHDLDMEFGESEIVSIIGANGAGKSSLLKAVMGHADVGNGHIYFDDIDVTKMPTSGRLALGMSMVPEGRRLFQSLSVEENLKIGAFMARPGGPTLSMIYERFPILAEKRRQRAHQLSGGQQQLVAICRSLLNHPRMIFFDEISLGLSPRIVKEIYESLSDIRKMGVGIVVVEQDITRSLRIADRFYCLLEGRVTLSGRPEDVSRDAVSKHYFGAHE